MEITIIALTGSLLEGPSSRLLLLYPSCRVRPYQVRLRFLPKAKAEACHLATARVEKKCRLYTAARAIGVLRGGVIGDVLSEGRRKELHDTRAA